jgi:signal transduction histidine kinase
VATVLVFGVGIAGAVVLAWTYHKPISQVVEAARRVAHGHLEERLPVNRRDEIGQLNRSFNEMVDGLRQKVDLEARLHRAERLSAIAHLASGIAHEVRNPLSTISMTIGHLAAQHSPQEPAAREEFQRLTSMVMGEIRRLNEMIETFLKYGKPLTLARRPADLAVLLNEVVEVAAPKAAAQQVRITRAYADDLPPIWADPAHLKTCFVNLALNALQAMPTGGTLAVAACRLPEGVEPSADAAAVPTADGWVEISLADTGVGIPAENLSRIFEPYFTTKEVGIGLGLALTKKIVEEHGGEIELASEPGKGTCARVTLPLEAPAG